jgi:putative flippase GtrA
MMKHIKDYISLFTDWTFLKFIMVGVVNTIVGTTIMFVFYNVFHLSYWVSSASNYFFGSIVSYLLNKNFTFRFRERGLWSLLRFTLNILTCYLLAYGIAKPVMQWILSGFSITVQENVSMMLGMCLFVVFNYLGQRFFTFYNKNK